MRYETEKGIIYTVSKRDKRTFAVRGYVGTDAILDVVDSSLSGRPDTLGLVKSLSESWDTVLQLTQKGGAISDAGNLFTVNEFQKLTTSPQSKEQIKKRGIVPGYLLSRRDSSGWNYGAKLRSSSVVGPNLDNSMICLTTNYVNFSHSDNPNSRYKHYNLYALTKDGVAISLDALIGALSKHTFSIYRKHGVDLDHPLPPQTVVKQAMIEIAETWGQGIVGEEQFHFPIRSA